MQTDEKYEDLMLAFEAQDQTFAGDDAFIEGVMAPIRKRSRWRSPLLFGAGGLGVGAAISQFENLKLTVSSLVPDMVAPVINAPDLSMGVETLNPLWIAAAGISAVCCVGIILGERA